MKKNNRFPTRLVNIGNVSVGCSMPIRIQSMISSPTTDIENTIDQILRLQDAGCEIVRMAVQGKKEAYACEKIKNLLIKKNADIPLVADVHFYPDAAMISVEYVDKVRINPGNFSVGNLEEVEEKFLPLIERAKYLKKALRIGVNHGSLSKRILDKFGNTTEGMVESACEYAKICVKYGFNDFLFSMKSSNTLIMIDAYKKLVEKMKLYGWDHPLHLGVTEAGEGEEGRIKSTVGIGTVLLQGIGDTIRISLTEDPVNEIDPCKRVISIYNSYKEKGFLPVIDSDENKKDEKIILFSNENNIESEGFIKEDNLIISGNEISISSLNNYVENSAVIVKSSDNFEKLKTINPSYILFEKKKYDSNDLLNFLIFLKDNKIQCPVIVIMKYSSNYEDIIINAPFEIGYFIINNLIDGIALDSEFSEEKQFSILSNILQGSRKRIFKTEFISCPGCGRTKYNLLAVAKEAKKRLSHLKGLKIAVMGCIVNGPGEMQDADFGVIGSKEDEVYLYCKKECVEKNIKTDKAIDKLIDLIKQKNMWNDK